MMMERRSPGQKDTSTYDRPWSTYYHLSGVVSYRYFGRAKDLPGVRELFESRKVDEDEDNQTLAYYKKFMNQGPAYYGDLDEEDESLLESERLAEEEGIIVSVPVPIFFDFSCLP